MSGGLFQSDKGTYIIHNKSRKQWAKKKTGRSLRRKTVMMSSLKMSMVTVSYTHLDVYKRQIAFRKKRNDDKAYLFYKELLQKAPNNVAYLESCAEMQVCRGQEKDALRMYERSSWYSLLVSVWLGATTIESPVWMPTGSMFSIFLKESVINIECCQRCFQLVWNVGDCIFQKLFLS